jgi:uroporphyrinogen decarboxylase
MTQVANPVKVRDARRARVEAAVQGGTPDRVPVSAWGHFYPQEISARSLADTMVDFFERHDWDYLKVHARASYHVEGWGFEYEASTDPAQLHTCTAMPIRSSADWGQLRPLPLDTPALHEQIEAIRYIRERVGRTVPLIMTVFSPLDVADKLVDRDGALLRAHIEENPQAVESAMAAIGDTFARFVAQLVGEGVDGIYFSTKWANDGRLTAEQYARFVRPFDLQVLEAAKPMWCNMLHLCEDAIRLDAMADYPVQVFHWDRSAGHNPGLAAGHAELGKAVGGGVDARTLRAGTPADVTAMARSAIDEMRGRSLLLGPGCSIQVATTTEANLDALRAAVET